VTRSRSRLRRLGLWAIGIGALVGVANLPTTTRQGVNYVVTARTVPAYVKAIDFVERSVNYEQLARQIAGGAASDEARMRAVLDWTRANIRDTPPGFPVVDDHVWHIVIRGYGQDDQKADVFTTLLSYAGVRAYWIFIGPPPELVLSLVEVDDRWRPIDVTNGVIFKAPDGQLATVEQLAAAHDLAVRQGPPGYRGLQYGRYFDGFRSPAPPDITRPEMQMFWPRLWFSTRRLAGGGGRAWEMRPLSRDGSWPEGRGPFVWSRVSAA
jgi:transglutaminase-like putative cysteine protease